MPIPTVTVSAAPSTAASAAQVSSSTAAPPSGNWFVDHSDPWGNAFEMVCSGDDVTVRSAGPDEKMGSSDDIVVPSS